MQPVHVLLASLLLIWGAGTAAARSADGEADGLVQIKSKNVDEAYLLPGADFSAYKKVILAPSEIAFQKNWLRQMNRDAGSLAERIDDQEARRILEAARSSFDEIWSHAFQAAGYQVVTQPGADVLKITPRVFDLYINAPDAVTASRRMVYTVETGEASLAVDVRDSLRGTLLGRASDRRTAGTNIGRLEWTTRVTNRSDFRRLFTQWATVAAEGLKELSSASPLPESLRPGQALPRS